MKTRIDQNVLGWVMLALVVWAVVYGFQYPQSPSYYDPEYSGVSHQGRW